MKSIAAALLTAQKTVGGTVIARASLADNGRPHFAELFTNATTTNLATKAVNTGTEIVRVRVNISAMTAEYQRITDPTVEAQWTAWTAFGALSNILNFALFNAGTHIVFVWQESGTSTLKRVRSADGGATWDASASAITGFSALAQLAGADGGATQSGIVVLGRHLATDPDRDLYWCAYNPATDAWAAISGAGLALNPSFGLAVAYDATNTRHIVAFATQNYVSWSFAPIAIVSRETDGTWATPKVVYGISATDALMQGVSLSQSKVNGLWCLTFQVAFAWTTNYYLTFFDDDMVIEDPTIIPIGGAYLNLEVLGAFGGYVWMSNDEKVYRSATQTFWSNKLTRHYKLSQRGVGELTAEVDNRDGLLTEPTMRSKLTIERGLTVSGTDYYVSAGTFFVNGFRYVDLDNFVEISAVDSLGLIEEWTADTLWRWDDERLDYLIKAVCAVAGVHDITFDASAVWSDTIGLFVINIDGNGLDALQSLIVRSGTDVVTQEDGGLYFFTPTASPASQYAYSHDSASGDHVQWPGHYGRGLAPTYLMLQGDEPDVDVAESEDFALQSSAGFRISDAITDRRVTNASDAAELVAARAVLATELQRVGQFESPPNFALEPGDIVTIGAGWANTNGPWRVIAFVEEFNGPRERKFFQRVFLRGTA